MQLPLYYINLDERQDRRQFMEEQFSRLGVSAHRISATSAEKAAERRHKGWTRGNGELGCTLSHRHAWSLLLASDAPAAVVLEDDAVLSSDFSELIAAERFSDVPSSQIIKLEVRGEQVRLGRNTWTADIGYEKRLLVSPHYGTCGYVIFRSAAGLASAMSSTFPLPVDHLLFGLEGHFLLNRCVYQLAPGACIPLEKLHDDASTAAISDIHLDRGRRSATSADNHLLPSLHALRQLSIAVADPSALLRRSVHFKGRQPSHA